ncbi:DUF6491 family protein [Brevundimonas balnearis]|uniref:DUF6491 family protein n=1 Tax=Brevundimonas balnearis TaxID=1572858 RepID=A0ABV6R524_9CAUL
MRTLTLSVLTASGLLGACAPTGGPSPQAMADGPPMTTCFCPQQIRNFRSDQDRTLYVKVARDAVFELDAIGSCPDLGSAIAIEVRPRFGGSDRLCQSDDAQVVIRRPSPTFSGPCYVRVAERLTPEQVAALPDRARP